MLQIEKFAGKGMAKFRLLEENFQECGLKSGDVRTTEPRFAEKKSVYCGKRRAPLRKSNGDFVDFFAKTSK